MTPDNLAAGLTDKVGDGHTFANIFSMWFRSMRYTRSCSRRSGLASKIGHWTARSASEEADSASRLETDGFDEGCDEAAFGSEMNRQERGNATCTLRCLLTLGGTGCGNRLEVLGRRWSAPVRILVWAFFPIYYVISIWKCFVLGAVRFGVLHTCAVWHSGLGVRAFVLCWRRWHIDACSTGRCTDTCSPRSAWPKGFGTSILNRESGSRLCCFGDPSASLSSSLVESLQSVSRSFCIAQLLIAVASTSSFVRCGLRSKRPQCCHPCKTTTVSLWHLHPLKHVHFVTVVTSMPWLEVRRHWFT